MSEEPEEPEEEVKEDQWDFYYQHMDGQPGSIMLDFAFDGYAPMDGFAKLTMVFIDMLDGGKHGLGDDAEEVGFREIEQALEAKIESLGCYYVGRVRHQAQWHLSFYGPADVDAEATATEVLEELERDHSSVTQDDPEWNYYCQFLLPSDDRRQWMADRTIVQGLMAAGDDLNKPRSVDHQVLFKTTQQRAAFATDAKEAGFTTELADDLDDSAWKHPVTVKRRDTAVLDHMHGVAMSITKMAQEYEGWYDGWGCDVAS